MVQKIRKRDNQVVSFDPDKIIKAVYKATLSTGKPDYQLAERICNEVIKKLDSKFKNRIPGVEDVQDLVEEELIKNNNPKTAKAYILYRKEREKIRSSKKLFDVIDDLKLSVNAVKVLKKRYLLRNDSGEIIEKTSELFKRVAEAVAESKTQGKKFVELMLNFDFLPNSPALMNAGTSLNQLFACFVLEVRDSIESIFEAVKNMAVIQKSGGGTGFNFSNLRPKGDIIKLTKGPASGPVSFMKIFDMTTHVIRQGGKRRGASIGVLNFNHPDIIDFITCKQGQSEFVNFNLSIGVTDKFMKAVKNNEDYPLINPRTNKQTGKISAKEIFNLIVSNAWKHGDPGLLFLDQINKHNPTPSLGSIESTNPCGEMNLLPMESCDLGAVNLSRMVKDGRIDYEKLEKTVKLGVDFLDRMIDATSYPIKEIERTTKSNRKIGLGIMGFAEMLIKLGIPYDSEEALKKAGEIMKFISSKAREESVKLGEQKGSFPNFKKSIWPGRGFKHLRNASITTIAPTGTRSIIADCSSGIEPLFAVAFVRKVLEGAELIEVNSLFEETARKKGFYSKELMNKIARTGSIQEFSEIPGDIKKLFKTAHDINYKDHIKMQAVFQKHVDNSISKTINLPENASIEDVKKAYMLAYDLRCKGITIYRYGSRESQVLNIGAEKYYTASSEFAGGCPERQCDY